MSESANALVPRTSEALPVSADAQDMVQRVERLEDVVAVLCDTKALEDRIVQRVSAQWSQSRARGESQRETLTMAPVQVDAVPVHRNNGKTGYGDGVLPPTATFADFVLPDVASPSTTNASLSGFALPMAAAQPAVSSKSTMVKLSLGMFPGSSFLRSVWWDVKTFFAMWRDPLYTMSIAARLAPFVALFFIFAVPLLRTVPVLGEFLKILLPDLGAFFGNLLLVVLLYLTFKVIGRELQRYHEFRTKHRR